MKVRQWTANRDFGSLTLQGSSYGKLSGPILTNNSFEEQQLWGAAFGGSFTSHFGEQLSVATLGSSFREPLCRIALGSSRVEL
jgi:hypothetical protein